MTVTHLLDDETHAPTNAALGWRATDHGHQPLFVRLAQAPRGSPSRQLEHRPTHPTGLPAPHQPADRLAFHAHGLPRQRARPALIEQQQRPGPLVDADLEVVAVEQGGEQAPLRKGQRDAHAAVGGGLGAGHRELKRSDRDKRCLFKKRSRH